MSLPSCASCGEAVDDRTPPATVCRECRKPTHLSCLSIELCESCLTADRQRSAEIRAAAGSTPTLEEQIRETSRRTGAPPFCREPATCRGSCLREFACDD